MSRISFLCLPFLLVLTQLAAESIRFPAGALVVDVTQAPYRARGDGRTDCTKAIQKALDDHPSKNAIIYLPAGTYLVSDTLRWGSGKNKGQHQKRTILQGENQEKTIIRLKDNASKFRKSSMEKRQAVIWTGNKPAQRFRNSIRDLTISTGRGNPKACGLQFNTSNQGTVENVTIGSEDGEGLVGLDLGYTSEIGNCFFHNVKVIGFETGVLMSDRVNGMIFDGLEIKGQREVGVHNRAQVVTIHRLKSSNGVPAIRNEANGVFTLVKAELVGLKGATAQAAIHNDAHLYLRDVSMDGYGFLLHGKKPRAQVAEYATQTIPALFGKNEEVGNEWSSIPRIPTVPWDAPEQWGSPLDFGANGEDDGMDDTAAFQQAIDSGLSTLYVPRGKSFRIDSDLFVRGKVRRMIGTEGSLKGKGRIRFVDGDAPLVVFERFEFDYGASNLVLLHESSRNVMIAASMLPQIISEGDGELYIVDVSSHKWRKLDKPFLELRKAGQKVYCWNPNPEQYNAPKIVNKGAQLVILGLKTENNHSILITRDGGHSELIGAHIYAQGKPKTRPCFVVEDARLSLAGVRQYTWKKTGLYEEYIAETRAGTQRTLPRTETVNNAFIPLFKSH